MSVQSQLTPPQAAMAMLTQQLRVAPMPDPVSAQPVTHRSAFVARLITFGGSLALTAIAVLAMAQTLPFSLGEAAQQGINLSLIRPLMWLLLGLFGITFGWVALTAMAALAGVLVNRKELRAPTDAPLHGRTVLLMPVYNEDPVSVCASLAAMARDLERLCLAEHFEIFIISDSDDRRLWQAESRTVRGLKRELSDTLPVWYRRRPKNTARKAGNIRDFINRWGQRYDYMVVLDADSVISAEALAILVREMEADPDLGVLQTLPRIIGNSTLYERLQEFANAIYGPVFARGLSAWQGEDGNYWGHNAIIRIRAFAESAGLPRLDGRRPFGGEIRSHDFVEAALMRRAGWRVRMLTELEGSWEESPPTLLDAAVRDRRWAQGNVQHLAVLPTAGLRWPSRMHMLMGIMNYASSPLWLASVLVGLALYSLITAQPAIGAQFDGPRMIHLFVATMGLLLVPKLLGLARGLLRRKARGGLTRRALVLNSLVEQLCSLLYAPVVMALHSRQMWEIFRGQDSGWSAQQRQGRAFPLRVLIQRHGGHTLAGIALTVPLVLLQSPLLYWMLPMTLGLMLAIPLSAGSSSKVAAGLLTKMPAQLTNPAALPPVLHQRQLYLSRFETIARSSFTADCESVSPIVLIKPHSGPQRTAA